jgi:hypothetical protein
LPNFALTLFGRPARRRVDNGVVEGGNGRARPSGFKPLDRDLLVAARALLRDGHAGAAVVTAHAATEVVAELVIGALLDVRGVGELGRPLRRMARFHLTHEGIRGLYEALSADPLSESQLWRRYQDHVQRRNGAAHGKADISLNAAEESIAVCDELVKDLLGVWVKAEDRYADE